jgi:hypothetical protein
MACQGTPVGRTLTYRLFVVTPSGVFYNALTGTLRTGESIPAECHFHGKLSQLELQPA